MTLIGQNSQKQKIQCLGSESSRYKKMEMAMNSLQAGYESDKYTLTPLFKIKGVSVYLQEYIFKKQFIMANA